MSSSNRGRLAVAGCCVVATLAYDGAVTTSSLATLVMPAVILVAVAALIGARLARSGAAAVLSALLAMALAQAVNVASGEFNGPAARSTFIAGVATALAVSLADRWSPAWICLPVAVVLTGALFLGAAGEVIPLVAVVVVLLTLTIPLLEGSRQRRLARLRTPWLLPVLALVAGAVALGTARLEVAVQDRAPKVFAIAQVEPRIEPLHDDPAPSGATQPDSTQPSTGVVSRRMGLAAKLLGAAAGALALLLLIRIALVAWAWRRLRRRLRRGTPTNATVGAWGWAVLRLRSSGVRLPTYLSPDQISTETSLYVSADVAEPLRTTARLATDAAFAPGVGLSAQDSREAWKAADEAAGRRRRELSRWRRALLTVRSVPVR